MELSALGIPLEPVRYIWLIAFIVYIGLCIVPAITHPATISREKAKELYIARYGSPHQQCNEVCRTSFPGG